MIKTKFARFAATTVGVAMAVGFASPAAAQADVIAQLQAQINALMAQLAALQGGTPATTTTFTQNLTVGSTGPEVVALQQFLVSKGHLTMPVGVAYGYFGPLTKAAVAAWQAASGIAPAAGYFGPISRAAIATQVGPVTPGTPVTPGITTPGVEGILTATLAPTPGSGVSVEEGEEKVKVLGIELEADLSDIRIERIKIQLIDATNGNDRDFYRDIAERLYIMDGSTVLATVELNSSTVIEEGSGDYFVTVTGINFVVPKDTEKTLTVAIDAQDSWDSEFDDDSWTVRLDDDGIRGVDGAGINQYTGTTAITRTFNTDPASMDTATLTISTNTNTPKAAEVIASEGSDEDELDDLEVLRFNAKAEDDDITITDLVVDITTTGVATTTTGYLYDGSTLLASDSVDTDGHSGFTFDDVDFTIPEGSTRVLTVKVDVADAGASATTIVADIDTADVTAENSDQDGITESGSATGNTITVRDSGLEVTLVSAGAPVYTAPQAITGATSTAKATFVFNLKAVGTDLYFGTQAASSTFAIGTYVGGTLTAHANSSTTSFITPTSGVTTSGIGATNAFKLDEDQDVNVTVEVIFPGRLDTGALVPINSYAFGVEGVRWSRDGITAPNLSSFMAGKTEWRTSSVTLP